MSTSSMRETEVELATSALMAYRDGDFETAIKLFSDLSKKDPELWDCRLFLGMSYFKTSRVSKALQEFKDIVEWCPDDHLKEKALAGLRAINSQSNDKLKAPGPGRCPFG